MAKNVQADMVKTVEMVHSSNFDWTIVRIPMLTDDPKTGKIQVGYVGKGMGARITREDMADFMVKQVGDTEYLKAAPAISN